jgi:hypothetical protein
MTKPINDLSFEEVDELLAYDPENGSLTWKVDAGTKRAGSIAGCFNVEMYPVVRIRGRLYKLHRIAWLLFYGAWPVNQIDHRDGDKMNLKIGNFRAATCFGNAQNKKLVSYNTSGIKGVSWHRRAGKWVVQITSNGEYRYLGLYSDKKLAAQAYAKAANDLHKEFARTA